MNPHETNHSSLARALAGTYEQHAERKRDARKPTGFDQANAGELRLSNPDARDIAEKFYGELWREFHPSATLKIIHHLNSIHHRTNKPLQRAFNAKREQGGGFLTAEKITYETKTHHGLGHLVRGDLFRRQ